MANAFGLKTSCCAITATFAYVQYASTRRFACAPFLAPKSLRQIGNPWFSERTPEVLTNLSWEVRFFEGKGKGIEALAKPIFVRGVGPFNGWRPVPPSLFIQNGFAGLVALGGRGARLPQRGQAPWRLAKPMRLPPKFPHMEFCIYPNKMPTHFILPESLIL